MLVVELVLVDRVPDPLWNATYAGSFMANGVVPSAFTIEPVRIFPARENLADDNAVRSANDTDGHGQFLPSAKLQGRRICQVFLHLLTVHPLPFDQSALRRQSASG